MVCASIDEKGRVNRISFHKVKNFLNFTFKRNDKIYTNPKRINNRQYGLGQMAYLEQPHGGLGLLVEAHPNGHSWLAAQGCSGAAPKLRRSSTGAAPKLRRSTGAAPFPPLQQPSMLEWPLLGLECSRGRAYGRSGMLLPGAVSFQPPQEHSFNSFLVAAHD